MRRRRRATEMLLAALSIAAVIVPSSDAQEIQNLTIAGNASTRIISPNFPFTYPNNADKTWIIRTEENHKIAITFVEFRVDTWRGGDYIQTGDGTNVTANQFFEENGFTLPPNLLSNGNEMWMRFITDYQRGASGFMLAASSVPSTEMLTCSRTEFDCGQYCIRGTLQCDRVNDCFEGTDELNCDEDRIVYIGGSETAELASTRYPSSYVNDIQITWIIRTEEARKISISFTQFYTQYLNDVFQAGDGNNSTHNVFFQWSGSRNPPDLLSAGNTMWLRFTADKSYQYQGFLLTARSVPASDNLTCSPYQFDCGHYVCIASSWQCDDVSDCFDGRDELGCDEDRLVYIGASETAELASTGYPSAYDNDIQITWIIRTEEARKIRISFSRFSTEYWYDVLQAGDGNNSTHNVFFQWSGYRNPPDLLSAGNTMWLRFTADENNRYSGFLLTARSVPASDNLTCSPYQFDCGHSVCIASSWQCDDVPDCFDGRDELGCGTHEIFLRASETATIHISSIHINSMWLIQTAEDQKVLITYHTGYLRLSGSYVLQAGDGDDSTNNASVFFEWSRESSYNEHIPPDLLSDGNKLWVTFEHGKSFNAYFLDILATSVPLTESLTCSLGDVDCGHSVCLSHALQCDTISDCVDGNDELDCDKDRLLIIPANETARICSTLYPVNYPINLNITWIVQTEVGWKIRIKFSSFAISTYTYYGGDVLHAGDGSIAANTDFFKWHGSRMPPDLLSTGSDMWLRFISDEYYSGSGFFLVVSSVPSSEMLTSCSPSDFDCGHHSVCIPDIWKCDGQVDCLLVAEGDEHNCHNDRVVFLGAMEIAELGSTNYPWYSYNIEITWIIHTDEDRKIRVRFSDFQTEHLTDFVQAGDGNRSTDNAFFRWSWHKLPPDLLSSGSVMWLTFKSDGSYNGRGFLLSVASVPATDRNLFLGANENTRITSPFYPSIYPRNLKTTWTIQTEANRRVLVTFHSFSGSQGGTFKAGDSGANDTFFVSHLWRFPPNLLSDNRTMWFSLETGKNNTIPCSWRNFDCGHSVCIDGSWRCDGQLDCFDDNDEENCDSCFGRCFSDGPRTGDCWCDAACELSRDCCSDYNEHCLGGLIPLTAQPDVDECNPDAPLHNCDDNAICNDTFESFTCTCRPGYEGNGVYCIDVEPPSITCPAHFTVYTDCRKSYSTVSLPDVQSASDNSGQYTISINIGGSIYEVGDTTTLSLGASPHMVRYTATDNSYAAHCYTYVTVAEVSDGTFCEETGSPPNCICKSNEGLDCTCFYKNCGHDCSQSAEGVECTGPGKPYPNCTDVDLCDPGYSGPRCDSDSNTLQCPEVDNRCLADGLSSVEISWSLGPPGTSSDVTCTDSLDGATVETTGGVFGVGMHHVVCSSADNAFPDCLITFGVSYFPSLTVPEVDGQCTDPGMKTSTVTWTEVHAVDAGEVTIVCTDSGDGVGVGVAGGVFGVGPHTITCRAVNDVGCSESKDFTFNVMEGNLVPFGEEIGDSLLSKDAERPHSAKDLISRTIYPPNFLPFGSKLYEKIYFTDNGVIVLSNDQSLDKRAFPSPQGKTFPSNRTMIAPFWADVKANAFTDTDNVFWQVHDQYDPNVNQNMLDVASLIVSANYSGFSANWALSITWRNVKAISPLETNTFQTLLVTDGVRAFVVFNYDPCGMNWDTSFLPNKNIIQGYTSGLFGETVYVDIPEESQFRPGGIVGNTGKTGRWVYRLDTLPDGFVNPRLSCHDWYHRQVPYPLFATHYPPFADTCPCSLWNARFDWRYTEVSRSVVLPDDGNSYPAVCYVRLFQVSGIPGPLCCYNLFGRDLVYDVRSARVASVFERYPLGPIFYTADSFDLWKREEVLPRHYCCQKSTLCHLYRTWRPLMSCRWYRPPAWVWLWGDPHIVTLDGLEYSFNGLGEYTLALIEDDDGQQLFELQGRTRQAVDTETGELSQATVYSGFAAVYTGEAKIEIKLSDDAMNLITTVNGTVVTPTAEGLQFDNLQVTRAENPIKVSVMYSDYITFSVGVNNSMADITVLFNEDFKGKTKGILGVWDDDPSNDALRRNGTLQTGSGDNGELVERDLFEFGETWRVVEEDSLFFYQSPAESYDSLNDPNFTPDFLQDLIDKAPPGRYDEAKAVCGSSRECLFDSLALNDTSIGMATSALNEMNMENMAIATNFPPNITLVDSIEVIVGKNFILQLEAVDPDGDDVTFELLEMVAGAAISASGRFSWTPEDKTKVKICFLATDGKANATLEPIVKLCDCQNNGTCLFDQYSSRVNIVQDRFGVVLCQCEPGWSGEFCEENYDACADNPCFLNVDCVDEDPPSLNSTCGPCPAGLEGDGKTCQDIDECELYRDQPASGGGLGCDQNCNNILMNFTCSCNAGYLLHEDGKRCIGIVESTTESSQDAVTKSTTEKESVTSMKTIAVSNLMPSTEGSVNEPMHTSVSSETVVTTSASITSEESPGIAATVATTENPATQESPTVTGKPPTQSNEDSITDLSTTTKGVTEGCHLSALSCLNGGTFDAEFCECVCPLTHSGMTCADENRCLSNNRCGNDQYCLPSNDPLGFTCHCNIIQGFVEGDSGQCQHYPSKNAVITVLMDFNDAFKNPASKAFNKTAAVFENTILKTLKEHPSTNGVLSVVVPLMEEGSVVIRSVALFETAAPSNAIIREVLANSDTLTDGSTVIDIDQNSILVDDEAIDCVPTYCMNGGTCETLGIFPYKNYACRCPESFSGKRCESEVLPHPEDGLSTLALAFIIIGSLALAVVVVVMLVCIVLHNQSLQAKVSANHRNKVAPIIVEEATMTNRVVDNISYPPDLQQGLAGREAFAMSYMVIGMENRSDGTADDVAGRLDRNSRVC
ncbi:uncharacterized protein LOC119720470 [Patiria miniata]|uniref:Uncharacterized protein n=1 Tax=Patiria miniata TaxID=46514 RepID=A0A913Z2K8_PATMI|nr:uncharacterized protein LOC119720470 [Patiria miniata]